MPDTHDDVAIDPWPSVYGTPAFRKNLAVETVASAGKRVSEWTDPIECQIVPVERLPIASLNADVVSLSKAYHGQRLLSVTPSGTSV